MKIMYADDSDYGQDILQIMGELAMLMEEDKLYTKNEICSHLNKIKNWAYNLKQRVMDTLAGDDYFNPFISVEMWHESLRELERQEKEARKA